MSAAKRRQAIGYLRAPRERGAGPTPNKQRQQIEKHCREHELDLAEIFGEHEGQTRPAGERQDLREAVRQAAQFKGVLVIAGLTCLARSAITCIRVANELRQAGADLVAIAEDIDTTRDAAFFRVMESLGGLELEHHKLEYHPPFGFDLADDGEHLVPVASEQLVIRRIIGAHAKGESLEATARQLNAEGVPGRRGAAWTAAAVKQVIDAAPTSRWGDG